MSDVPDAMRAAQIEALPNSFYYLPNIITPEQETQLMSKIQSQKWVELSRRRLQVYPCQLTKSNVLLASEPLPSWLTQPIEPVFKELGVFAGSTHERANHILVNQYQPGEGIMPHEDGAAYDPITATLSLGGHTILDIYKKKPDGEREESPTWRILQEGRSLLVTRDEAYGVLLHGIRETEKDGDLHVQHVANWSLLADPSPFEKGHCERTTRISLTCRDVRKVSKLGGKLVLGKR